MAKKSATKAEREHMAKVASLGCIACRKLGYPDTPAELHHPRKGIGMGQRNDHMKVIPLCPAHHRHDKDAVHVSPATFKARFGSEEELLSQVLELIE